VGAAEKHVVKTDSTSLTTGSTSPRKTRAWQGPERTPSPRSWKRSNLRVLCKMNGQLCRHFSRTSARGSPTSTAGITCGRTAPFTLLHALSSTSLKGSVALAHQFLHRLPTGVWYPATETVQPGRSLQGGVCLETQFAGREYLFSVEGTTRT